MRDGAEAGVLARRGRDARGQGARRGRGAARQGASRVQVEPLAGAPRARPPQARCARCCSGPTISTSSAAIRARRRAFMDEAVVALVPASDTLRRPYDKVAAAAEPAAEGVGSAAARRRDRGVGRAARQGRRGGDPRARPSRRGCWRRAPPRSSSTSPATSSPALRAERADRPASVEATRSARQLESRRADELQRRTSLVGPHRDDLELAVRDLGARGFASHGEAWAAALSLRLGLADAVGREIGEPPILLVDDPFSALDPRRRDRVARAPRRPRGPGRDLASPTRPTCPRRRPTVWERASGRRDGARLAAERCRTRRGSQHRADTRTRQPCADRRRRGRAARRGRVRARDAGRDAHRAWPQVVGERLAEATAPVSIEARMSRRPGRRRPLGSAGDVTSPRRSDARRRGPWRRGRPDHQDRRRNATKPQVRGLISSPSLRSSWGAVG